MSKLKSFKNYCTCGGYAHTVNGRSPRRPHMIWCPQREEYNEWFDKTYPDTQIKRVKSNVEIME